MKTAYRLVVAAALLGSGSAFAADPGDQYLTAQGLLDVPVTAGNVVNQSVADGVDATTRYLFEAGLVEAPTAAKLPSRSPRVATGDEVRRLLVKWGLLQS